MLARGLRDSSEERRMDAEEEGQETEDVLRDEARNALQALRPRFLQCLEPADNLPTEMIVRVRGARVRLDELNPSPSQDAEACLERELDLIRLSSPNYTGFRLRYHLDSP